MPCPLVRYNWAIAVPASQPGFPLPESPVVAARRLSAHAAARAVESESARRLAPELASEIARAGLFGLCAPASAGGLEAPPAALVECVEALACGDGAAGWCLAVGATSGLLLGYLPQASAREVFSRPDVVLGGVFAPRGRATPTADGFRVSGRWPFASGCQQCDWLMGGCVVAEGEGLRSLPSGMPDIRLMLAPASEVRIHDTWNVMGLRGSGSHDIEFDGLSIPLERSASVLSDTPSESGPLYAFPLFGLLALAIAAVSLGIARGAIDDLVGLAGTKTPAASTRRLADRATIQAAVAQAEGRVRAARALLMESVDSAWQAACSTGEVAVEERAAIRLASTHAAVACAEAVSSVYTLGGGSAISESSSLQRRFRDAHVATQHMIVAPATWELAGRLLLGLETDTVQL